MGNAIRREIRAVGRLNIEVPMQANGLSESVKMMVEKTKCVQG